MPIIKSYYKVLRVQQDPDYVYFKNLRTSQQNLSIKKKGSPTTAQTLEYSFDKITWTPWSLGNATNTILVPSNSTVYIRCSDGFSESSSNYYMFACEIGTSFEMGGDLTTLIDYTSQITTIPSYSFYNLFNVSHGYPDHSGDFVINGLNTGSATILESYSCSHMFFGPSNGSIVSGNVINIFPNITELREHSLDSILASNSTIYINSGINISNVTIADNTALTNMYSRSSIPGSGDTYINEVWAPNVQSFSAIGWLNNCGETGIVYAPAGLTIPTDSNSGIPTGWTRVDY